MPNYWADPNSGIAYQIQVQIPQAEMSSVEQLENLPVAYENGQPVLLRSLASVTPGTAPRTIRALQHAADDHGHREYRR